MQVWKFTKNNQKWHLASAKPKPCSIRDALELMEESSIREGKHPGDGVSRVTAYHNLVGKFIYWWFLSLKKCQYLIVCREKVDPSEIGVDLSHFWLLSFPLVHKPSTQAASGRPDHTTKVNNRGLFWTQEFGLVLCFVICSVVGSCKTRIHVLFKGLPTG